MNIQDLKIMIVTSNNNLVDNVERVVQEHKGLLLHVRDHGHLLSEAYEHRPNAIIVDCQKEVPRVEGMVATLKSDNCFQRCPIIALTDNRSLDTDRWSSTRFDDIILLPFSYSEFFCRLRLALNRTQRISDNSILTNLPGPLSVQQEVERSISLPRSFCLIDINNLQPYNSIYGYQKGDEAITVLGRIIVNSVQSIPGTFVGHFCSDDFALIAPSDVVEKLATDIIKNFAEMNQFLFPKSDYDRGHYMAHNRKGNYTRYNLLSLAIAIIPLDVKGFDHFGKVMATAHDIKDHIGKNGNNGYFVERRGR